MQYTGCIMAVYTRVSEKDLTQHLTRYDIGAPTSFEGIAEGVENTNYRMETDRGIFILTLLEKRTRAEDLPFFIDFMAHLQGRGIPCPRILPDNEGKHVHLLNEKPAIVASFLEGTSPQETEDFHIIAVGKTLAQMHAAGESLGLRRDNAMSLPAWRKLIAQCGEKTDQLGHGLSVLLQTELAYLEKHWPQGLPSGAIHADLFPDNVFFKDGKLSGIIDFYFSCTDTLAYDLMLTLNAWCCGPGGAPDPHKASLFLNTYQKERPLSAAEKESLTFFGRAAALRIIATRLYDFLHRQQGATVNPKDPLEYLRILNFYRQEDGAP